MKAPRSGVSSSATRLDRPGHSLPWAQLSVHRNASDCKGRGRAIARRGLDGVLVCSKDANGHSFRRTRRLATAAWRARRGLGVGVGGGPAGCIAAATRAKRGGASRRVVIASGCASARRKQRGKYLIRRRARASAQHRIPKNLAAFAPAATNCSCAAFGLHCRSAAEGCVDGLYGACESGKLVGAGDGASDGKSLASIRLGPAKAPSAERRILQRPRRTALLSP